MLDAPTKVKVLAEALPYIQHFRNKVIIAKYGGNAMLNEETKTNFARDVVLLKAVGMHPVIVHGGGPDISNNLKQKGISGEFYHGIRMTSDKAMAVVAETLQTVNQDIAQAVKVSGGDPACFTTIEQIGTYGEKMARTDTTIDLGRAGIAVAVSPALTQCVTDSVKIPVVSPLGIDENKGFLNINADLVAANIASKLKVEKLIFMTNTAGILDAHNELIVEMTPQKTKSLIKSGVIQSGMLPKVQCAFDAVDAGVHAVHIIDGRVQHSLLLELLTDEGVGTLICAD